MRRARRRGGVKRVGDMERHDEGDKKRFKKRSSSHVKTLIHVASDGARRAMVREDDERVLTQRGSSSHAYTKGSSSHALERASMRSRTTRAVE